MIELDARAEQFLHSIRAEGERKCAAIRAETDQQVDQTLAATRKAEQARADRILQFELERARTQANRALSDAQRTARTELAARRTQLAEAVFADARAALTAFTASKEYAAWLLTAAQALVAKLGEGAVVYARPADVALLTGKVKGCTVEADNAIVLGGLKAARGALAADDTLEARLEAQRDWFLQNAGLTITI